MKYALKESVGYRLNQCANTINSELNKLLHPHGIAIEQRATLEIIKFEPQVNQTKIAKLLGKDKTTICRAINTLEKKGLICKSGVENDKRSKTIHLTPKAENLLNETQQEIATYRQTLNAKLSNEELTTLFNTLNKLSPNL